MSPMQTRHLLTSHFLLSASTSQLGTGSHHCRVRTRGWVWGTGKPSAQRSQNMLGGLGTQGKADSVGSLLLPWPPTSVPCTYSRSSPPWRLTTGT